MKFNHCRNVYPICIIKPCERFKYDEQEFLQKVLTDINANDIVIDCIVLDNLKRSIFRCAKNHAGKFACEYCFNFAIPYVDLKKKSLTLIKKKYEAQERKLSHEIQKLQNEEELGEREDADDDDSETDYLTHLRETLANISQEKETELKKKEGSTWYGQNPL